MGSSTVIEGFKKNRTAKRSVTFLEARQSDLIATEGYAAAKHVQLNPSALRVGAGRSILACSGRGGIFPALEMFSREKKIACDKLAWNCKWLFISYPATQRSMPRFRIFDFINASVPNSTL
jgi:hypothetical protein